MPQSKRHPARRPQQRPARPDHRPNTPGSGRSGPGTRPAATSTGWRRSLERASAGPLLILSRLPRWLVPGALAILLILGLALPSIHLIFKLYLYGE